MNYPYSCRIDIQFPTDRQADQAMQVLQVDREPSDRVTKYFSVVSSSGSEGGGEDGKTLTILRV